MTEINLTSNTGSGFLEADFNQVKQALQTGGVELVNVKLTTPTDTTQSVVTVDATQTLTAKTLTSPTVTGATISTSTLTSSTITSSVINTSTMTGGTLASAVVTSPTISTAAISSSTLTSCTLSTASMANTNLTGIKQATFNSVIDNGTVSTSTKGIDWTSGSIQKLVMGASATFTFTAPTATSRLTLFVTQDGTGSRTVTWPTVKWAGAAAPTLTTTASRTDIVTFIYDGSSYYGSASLNFN